MVYDEFVTQKVEKCSLQHWVKLLIVCGKKENDELARKRCRTCDERSSSWSCFRGGRAAYPLVSSSDASLTGGIHVTFGSNPEDRGESKRTSLLKLARVETFG